MIAQSESLKLSQFLDIVATAASKYLLLNVTFHFFQRGPQPLMMKASTLPLIETGHPNQSFSSLAGPDAPTGGSPVILTSEAFCPGRTSEKLSARDGDTFIQQAPVGRVSFYWGMA